MDFEFEDMIPISSLENCMLKADRAWMLGELNGAQSMRINLYQGMIGEYDRLDDGVAVLFDNIELKLSLSQFDELFTPLPQPPQGLIFCTLNEAFDIENKEFWIFDMEAKTFLQASAFPQAIQNMNSCIDISSVYSRDRYGSDWAVLVKEA